VGLVGPTLCLAVEKAPSATGVVPSRGISLGRQVPFGLVIHSCGEQSPRGSIASRVRTSTRPSAPREIAASGPLDGRHLEPTAGSCSSRSHSLPEVLKRVRSFPPCRSRRCPHGPRSGGARFADFGRATSWMRGGFAPLPRGVNVPLSGETSRARGHAATTCNVIVDVTGASPLSPLPSKARLQETWRSGIGSSAIVVRGSSGVSTPGAPRGRRRKVSSVGAFSSCVDAALFSEPRAPLTRERASRRHRRPRPTLPSRGGYLLSGAIPTGLGMDGAARTSRFWLPPRASSRVGRGLEGSCCLVLAEGRFDDRSDRVSLFDSPPGLGTGGLP
jgi:hypothetical protein